MSFVLLLVNNIVAINEAILEPNELQGMAGDKSPEACLSRVENRLAYGLIGDDYSLASS
jgi:death-on-curing protein